MVEVTDGPVGGPAEGVLGRAVVVIGATSGIGAATARLLAARGAKLVFAGRRTDRGQELASQLGPWARFERADVTVERDVQRLIDLALELHGHVDGVVNCAGESLPGGPIERTDVAQALQLVADAVAAALLVTKHAARAMLPAGSGSIVHVASLAGHRGGWSGIAYSAAKAAVLQVARSAAVELGEQGIRVNSVSPGPIQTAMFAKAAGVDSDAADRMTIVESEFLDAVAPWQPVPRAGQPLDVGHAITWLLSDVASFVNGIDVAVDGGISAGRPASVGMPARKRMVDAFRTASVASRNDKS